MKELYTFLQSPIVGALGILAFALVGCSSENTPGKDDFLMQMHFPSIIHNSVINKSHTEARDLLFQNGFELIHDPHLSSDLSYIRRNIDSTFSVSVWYKQPLEDAPITYYTYSYYANGEKYAAMIHKMCMDCDTYAYSTIFDKVSLFTSDVTDLENGGSVNYNRYYDGPLVPLYQSATKERYANGKRLDVEYEITKEQLNNNRIQYLSDFEEKQIPSSQEFITYYVHVDTPVGEDVDYYSLRGRAGMLIGRAECHETSWTCIFYYYGEDNVDSVVSGHRMLSDYYKPKVYTIADGIYKDRKISRGNNYGATYEAALDSLMPNIEKWRETTYSELKIKADAVDYIDYKLDDIDDISIVYSTFTSVEPYDDVRFVSVDFY